MAQVGTLDMALKARKIFSQNFFETCTSMQLKDQFSVVWCARNAYTATIYNNP